MTLNRRQFLASTDSVTVIPPLITTAPASQTLRVGQSTTLVVTAEGTGLTYEWYTNDLLISGQTTSTLALDNVTAANDGAEKAPTVNF